MISVQHSNKIQKMPELPEVETLKRYLNNKIIGIIITKVDLKRTNLRYKLLDNLRSETILARILNLRRRAKYLIIDLNNDHSIIVHLGMSGRFTLQSSDYLIKKHDHVIFSLANGTKLVFNDPRRFGMIYVFQTNLLETLFLKNCGIEPLSDNFNTEYLKLQLLGRKMPIKNLLMNNHLIAGIGNIYASESLFVAKIHPTRLSKDLSDDEIQNLVIAIKNILTKAILAGGTTLKDFVNGDSKAGYFQQELLVYARGKQKCTKCDGIITKLQQSGRVSFYCPLCQQ